MMGVEGCTSKVEGSWPRFGPCVLFVGVVNSMSIFGDLLWLSDRIRGGAVLV